MSTQRILIIDDEENVRQTMQVALETEGYTVGTAADGPEGLRRFRDEPWDLILLDQRMPGMEGLEVLRQIRASPAHPPVLLMTAYGTVELAADVLRSGARGFLRKPFIPDELRRVVRETLEG